jgi:hypothetical protein
MSLLNHARDMALKPETLGEDLPDHKKTPVREARADKL